MPLRHPQCPKFLQKELRRSELSQGIAVGNGDSAVPQGGSGGWTPMPRNDSVASAMIVHVRLVNDTSDPENARIVPQWAVADGEGNQFWEINPELGGRWLIPEKSADGKMVVELIGIPYTWQFYPLFSLIVGFALGGFGFWSWTQARRDLYAQDDDDDDDFDFDDDDFDFDDEDL